MQIGQEWNFFLRKTAFVLPEVYARRIPLIGSTICRQTPQNKGPDDIVGAFIHINNSLLETIRSTSPAATATAKIEMFTRFRGGCLMKGLRHY